MRGFKNRTCEGERRRFTEEGGFAHPGEMRLFALAFTGKCRVKQSGIKAAPRVRLQAAPGWTNILEMENKTPAGAESLALDAFSACDREASESAS